VSLAKTVKYSVNRWDILRWHFYLLVRNRVLAVFMLIATGFFVWNDLKRPELAEHGVGFRIFYGVFFAIIMLSIVGAVTMLLTALTIVFKKFRGFLGEHELEFREDGLIERTDVNESIHRWTGFHKFVVTRKYFYLYVTDNNVHVVPRRCFASQADERAFQEEIAKHLSARRSLAPP